jgi:amino acid transporter/nucleotide-binding universal stress UspA family protein
MNNTTSHSAPAGVTLSRSLSVFTITMIGVGGMIGAGIFVLTGIAAGVAGPALVLVFFLNGVVTLFTAMVYAELGSAFPEAGGGYLWVKEALGGAQGFLAGWMSWFAHMVAGSLYALGFGRFATEAWMDAGLPNWGLSVNQMTLILMTLVVIIFTTINYRGASETGTVGNIVTMTKIIILVLFVLFGLLAMARSPGWQSRFTDDFMPNGFWGVLVAMGLTFIAFEGYEIIAQSGEEVRNPKRNIPRAIFGAIGIAVIIYIFVGITSIGAVIPPANTPVYKYLGELKEIAVVQVAAHTFPFGIGGFVLLFSGLVSTASALNATTYSSSRVSFAMGRDHNLPAFFARIHPQRHTPNLAVLVSGSIMILVAWLLPIEGVAAAADIMFLLLFFQVNIAMMILRHKMPNLDRGFIVPWFPLVPILGLLTLSILAVNLIGYSPLAWATAVGWIIVGLLAYYTYFSKIELVEKPKEILLEESLVSRDYSVLVPVATQGQARVLGQIGAILAQANQGEVLALHVVHVPQQITLGEGRLFLKEGRSLLETVIQQAKPYNVPVHTVLRLGRNVADAVHKTVEENASDMVVLGWPGYTNTSGRLFGSVIDPIVRDPPAEIAVVRYRQYRPVRAVLVPVAGGPNSHRAVRIAVHMAAASQDGPVWVTLLHILGHSPGNKELAWAEQVFRESLQDISYEFLEKRVVSGNDVVETILDVAANRQKVPGGQSQSKDHQEGYDLIVIGATREPLLKNLLIGNIPSQVAQRANVTVIMVKRRNNPIRSLLRQTVLTTAKDGG